MSSQPKFYITTAIPYASQKPHFGNTYEVILTDALARYRRAMGYDVYFCTGADEHGQKVEDLAAKEGVSPKAYVDHISGIIRGIWDKMNTTYTRFIRTTDEDHCEAVEKIFKKFYEQGDIYKGFYEGWYCVPDETFFTETQVVDGKCPECGRPLQRGKEEAYYFKMSKYADKLLEHIETHPEFIQPESRRKEMVNNFLKVEGGLQDLCVSRTSVKWGVKTFDPKHVIYVWIDALSNYITALGYDPDKTFENQCETFKKYWPADVHIIGKDILRFHTIYWPIFLMALGLPLPQKIFGHPWFLFGQDKMSKSRGNVIYADELADDFNVDTVRYFALAEMPYGSDGSITYESVIKRYNNDLVNNLGNLVKRTLDMQKKYFDKQVVGAGAMDPLDEELLNACLTTRDTVIQNMDSYHVADAIASVFELLDRANKYIDQTTPWSLAKDPAQKDRLATVLYRLLATIKWAGILLHPFLPDTAETILKQINDTSVLEDLQEQDQKGQPHSLLFPKFLTKEAWEQLPKNMVVSDSIVMFARVDETKKMEELISLHAPKTAEPPKPEKPEGIAQIGIEDFEKVELRTAQVIACEPIPKAKKLLKLRVDLGYEQRQVVSGIAKWYTPEKLIGKKLVLVANLKPVTLCGVESCGMILASGEEDVKVIFLDPETPLGQHIH